MITITVKWMSGEIEVLEVPYNIQAYKLAQHITKEPLYKVYIFQDNKKVSHTHRFKEDVEVMIAILEPPRTAIAINTCGVDYIIPTYSTIAEPEYERVYVDELSYYGRQPIDFGEKEMGNISYIDFCMVYQTLTSTSLGEEIKLTWNDFIRRFSLMFSKSMLSLLFPTLESDVKRRVQMTEKEWMSYMAVVNYTLHETAEGTNY